LFCCFFLFFWFGRLFGTISNIHSCTVKEVCKMFDVVE
jgi:hypothetical protein